MTQNSETIGYQYIVDDIFNDPKIQKPLVTSIHVSILLPKYCISQNCHQA